MRRWDTAVKGTKKKTVGQKSRGSKDCFYSIWFTMDRINTSAEDTEKCCVTAEDASLNKRAQRSREVTLSGTAREQGSCAGTLQQGGISKNFDSSRGELLMMPTCTHDEPLNFCKTLDHWPIMQRTLDLSLLLPQAQTKVLCQYCSLLSPCKTPFMQSH